MALMSRCDGDPGTNERPPSRMALIDYKDLNLVQWTLPERAVCILNQPNGYVFLMGFGCVHDPCGRGRRVADQFDALPRSDLHPLTERVLSDLFDLLGIKEQVIPRKRRNCFRARILNRHTIDESGCGTFGLAF